MGIWLCGLKSITTAIVKNERYCLQTPQIKRWFACFDETGLKTLQGKAPFLSAVPALKGISSYRKACSYPGSSF